MDHLPQFDFDSAPDRDVCERCGAAGADADLRFVILRGRTRYAGRTLCDMCSEEVLESLLETDAEVAPAIS